MRKTSLCLIALLTIISLILTACGGNAQPTQEVNTSSDAPAPTDPPAPEESTEKVTK